MLCTKNQVLVQMQHVPSAVNALKFYANVQPNIRGRNVYVQFSSHQELTTMDQSQGRGDEPNRILLVTVHHVLYPMTVDVLYQVFSPHGSVEKIALRLSSSINNVRVLFRQEVHFSLDELQVNYNNDRSRDFTNPDLPTEQKGKPSQPGYGDVGNMYPAQDSRARAGAKYFKLLWLMANVAAIAAAFGGGLPPGVSGTNDRCTVVVSNLNPNVSLFSFKYVYFRKLMKINY
ncbi:Polypyrimidine tract-binding 3 [Glycine soja]